MRSFEVFDATPPEFVDRVRRELVDRGLNGHVEILEDQAGLIVRFRYLGTTELRYRVEPQPSGFRAVLSRERVSPFHAPFRDRFEDQFEEILGRIGANPLRG